MDLGTAVASSWSSGISMYLVFSVLGIGGRLDWVDSPAFLQKPWVIVIALTMFVVELIVDKISYVDSTWDAVHTFLRPLAGAFLFSSSDVSTSTVVLALVGARFALTAHGAKASTRLLVNASPEPASNFVVSLMEDGLVAALMTLALAYPAIAATVALVLTVVSVIVIYVVVRSARFVFARRRARRRRYGPHGTDVPEKDREMGYADDLFDLSGRVALVTGGSRGLGREMVRALARCGADVVITSRKFESCEELAQEIWETTGRAALPYACHVGRWDELDRLTDAAYERFGRVDVLINNAGKSPTYPSVADVNEQMWDSVLNLNLRGPFRLATLVGTRMVEAGRGSIINISSSGALRPDPSFAPYAAAKAGLNNITESLAKAFGPTVRVNCISSGPFHTDATAGWPDETKNLPTFALQRMGNPPEIVGAAMYFASDASSFTTGSILRVDGGMP